MSKKKINNRLDKLFEDIDKEPEANSDRAQIGSTKKADKADEPAFLISTAGDSIDPVTEIDFPHLLERTTGTENFHQASSTMLSTAFRTDEKSWATLKVVDETRERTWGTEEQMLIKQVADQLSLALENARLFQEAQRRAREMTALADVAREISATLELRQVMERISNQALLILNGATSAVYVPDTQFQFLAAITASGFNVDKIKTSEFPIGNGILGNIANNKVAEIHNNVSNNQVEISISQTDSAQHQHLMGAPILSKNQLSGLLAVWRVGENEQFSETELEFLESLAQQAAIAVENARLFEETQERAEELSVLNEMARELSAEMNIFSIADTAYRYIKRLIDATNFRIALIEENTNQISFPVFIEKNERMRIPARNLKDGLTEYVIQTREPLYIPSRVNEYKSSMELGSIKDEDEISILCWLGVPLLVGNKSIGAMTVQSVSIPELYSEHDKELMMTIASQVAIAMENARLFKDAQARARREKILREITARIRATNDPELIAKAAIRELGQALGIPTFIRLGRGQLEKDQATEVGKIEGMNEKNAEGGL
jgi:GAF domain-containing protein